MKYVSRPLSALLGALLLSTSFSPVEAQERSATNNNAITSFGSLMELIARDLSTLDDEIDAERAIRAQRDLELATHLQSEVARVDGRITALANRLPALSTKIEGFNTTVGAEVTVLRNQITTLRADMNREFGILRSAVATINSDAAASFSNLQAQINASQARINDLYNQVAALNTRVTNVNNFLTDIYNRYAALRACVNAGGCVTHRPLSVSLANDVGHYAGWEFFGSGMYGNNYNTGISTSTYQYCAVSGNTGMGGRDFYVYPSGGTWWMANERDNAAPGDESGTLYMNCFHIS